MPARPSLLFHTIVVVGASVGCGELAPTGAGDASTGPPHGDKRDSGPRNTGRSDGGPDGPGRSDAHAGPHGVCDCVRPGMFRCHACASGTGPIDGRCPYEDGVGCFCDDSIKIAAPSDCTHPEQFVCEPGPEAQTHPSDAGLWFTDWFYFAKCRCDGTRPFTGSQCTCPDCGFQCTPEMACPTGTPGWTSKEVEYACACLPAFPIPK
jgi:hypothetical protein